MSSIFHLISELRTDVRGGKLLPALLCGSVLGATLLVYQMSVGLIVFSGPLAAFSAQGVSMALFGGFVVCALLALTGGYPGTIGVTFSFSIVLWGTIGATIPAEGPVLFYTMVATVVVGMAATGLCLLLLGHFRLSGLLRFIPYPVAAGYIAGVGVVLSLGALSLMGTVPDWSSPASLLEPAALGRWGPGVALGLILHFAAKRWDSLLIPPAGLLAASLLYHLGLGWFDVSLEEAGAAGLFLTGAAGGPTLPVFQPGALAHIDWTALLLQVPNILILILLTLLCTAVNLSGLELATNSQLDWNRELRATGLANLAAGAGAGPPGSLDTGMSARCGRQGANTRLSGLVAALVVGSTLLVGDEVARLLPLPLAGGLLLWLGLGLMEDWLLASRKRLPRADYAILLLICAVIVVFGIPEGIGVGVLVTMLFFVTRLARVDPVEAEFTARVRRSNRSRPIADQAILLADGERIRAYRLRGHIFFGSAHSLTGRLRPSLDRDPPPVCILLDFSAVTGLDFSAVNALCMFVQSTHDAGVRVAFGGAPENCRDGLERNLPEPVFAALRFEPDSDLALERCEDFVIAARRADLEGERTDGDTLLDRFAENMERHLDRRIVFEDIAHELRDFLEVCDYETGEALVAMGAPQPGLQLLLAGRASVFDSSGARLRQCGPGDVLDPRGAFGAYPATTATIAEEPCRTLLMGPATRRQLEQSRHQLMLELYGYLLSADPGA